MIWAESFGYTAMWLTAGAIAALGTLAAGIAHEINNPLASIVAGVESLQRWLAHKKKGAPLDARAQEAQGVLQLLDQEARRVSEITDKLMLLAQPYSVTPVWVDLNRAAADVLHGSARTDPLDERHLSDHRPQTGADLDRPDASVRHRRCEVAGTHQRRAAGQHRAAHVSSGDRAGARGRRPGSW